MFFQKSIYIYLILWSLGFSSVAAQDLYKGLFEVSEITITGNDKTKEATILRELYFQVGDSIAPSELVEKIENSKSNLHNTLLFNFVAIVYQIDGFQIKFTVELTERWYIWPVPIFEIAERNLPAFLNSPNWEEINYGFFLNSRNFSGRKEFLQLKARWGYKEQLSHSFVKPIIGKKQQHGFEFGLNKFRQHEVLYRTEKNQPSTYSNQSAYIVSSFSVVATHTYRPKFYAKHQVSLAFNTVSLHEDSLRMNYYGSNADVLKWFNFQYLFEYDKRDFKIYPLHGYLVKAGISKRGIGILDGFTSPKTILHLSGSKNSEIAPRLYFENVAKIRLTKDTEQPNLFRQALGYSAYLRGFELYTVDGNSFGVSVNNLKYNLLPTRNFKLPLIPWEQFSKMHLAIYTNLFFDMAYVQGKYYYNPALGNTLQNKLLYSTGIGIDLVSYYDQVFRFEFTVNSLGQSGIFLHLETPFRRW